MAKFHADIVGGYLYPITKYGYPPPAGNTILYLEELSYLGFSNVELGGIGPDHIREVFNIRNEIAERADEIGVNIPVFCVKLPRLGSHDAREVSNQLKFFKMGCEIAKRIGSTVIMDNGPLPPFSIKNNDQNIYHYDLDIIGQATLPSDFNWNAYWEGLVNTYAEVCQIADWYGLEFHIHPATGTLASTPESFVRFFESVGVNNLKFTLDTADLLYLKVNLVLAIHQLGPHISYVHISDSRGFIKEHLPPEKGIIDWLTFFQELRKSGFSGKLGVDIGGPESGIRNLDKTYRKAASWLQKNWFREAMESESNV